MNEQTEREAFEAWASDGGKWPQAIERYGNGLYRLSSTHSYWLAWQARASMQAQAPEVAALQREVEELRAANARLIEDRARFPDRPDDIGAMIGARYNNLKATAKANEDAWRSAQRNADANALAAERYSHVRTLTPADFRKLGNSKLVGPALFDEFVDALIAQRASKAEVPNG